MSNQSNGKDQEKKFPDMPANQPEKVAQPAVVDISDLVKTILENLPKQASMSADDLAAAIKAQNSNGKKLQAHNLSVDEMRAIKEAQMRGNVEMIPANKISKFTIPKHEAHLMHFSTERLAYNADTGVKTSRPKFHVMTATEFTRMSKSVKEKGDKANPENAFEGKKVVIYHDVRPGALENKKEGPGAKQPTPQEMLDHMDEQGVRKVYLQVIGEEPLPSDSKAIMIGLIKEKIESSDLVE